MERMKENIGFEKHNDDSNILAGLTDRHPEDYVQ
jgi:hypothetical protein